MWAGGRQTRHSVFAFGGLRGRPHDDRWIGLYLHPDLGLHVFCGFLSCSAAIVHASGSVRGGGDRFRIHGFLGALHSLGKGTSQEKGGDWTGTLTIGPDLLIGNVEAGTSMPGVGHQAFVNFAF